MILVHFVEVRILTGLPFFCLEKSLTVSKEYAWKQDFQHTLFSYSFATAWHTPRRKDFLWWLPCVTRPAGLRYSGSLRVESLRGCHFFCLEKGKKNMKPVKASLHAPKVRFTARSAASHGAAVLHKLPWQMKHCFALFHNMKHLRYRSDMKHKRLKPLCNKDFLT